MRSFKRAVTFALAAACVSAMGIEARAQDTPKDTPRGDVAQGKRLYLDNACFTCHGRAGQGGAYNGPAPVLAQTAMPFVGFLGQIRNPSNDMPAYSPTVMSDQAVADVLVFVQSLPGPRPAKDIAILRD